MKTLQNNFTTPEQSKRLLELGVPADSADCWYNSTNEHGNVTWFHMGIRYCCMEDFPDWSKTWRHGGIFSGEKVPYYLPCWSVGRLMEIIAECYQVDMPFRYFVRGGMMESLINTFIELRGEIDFSKLEG